MSPKTGVTVLAALALAGCQSGPTPEQLAQVAAMVPDVDATRVEVATVRPSTASLTLNLPGEIEGWNDSLLAAGNGGIVDEVRVSEGDDVAKGDVLVVIDGDLYRAQLAQAEAQLSQARADLDRAKALGEYAVDAEVSRLTTQVAVAETSVRMARIQVDRAVLRAPFAGTVGTIGVDVGEMAGMGSPAVRLVQLDPIKVTLSVSDRDVVALRTDMAARVSTHAVSGIRQGTISHISPVADLQTRSFVVEVRVPNPDHDLLPGMIAQVEVDRTVGQDAVVLPQDWIVTKLDGYGVFVAEDGVAHWREVTLGDVVRGQIVVTSGVSPGDRVVMVGQHDLVDGDPLIIARDGFCCEDGRAVYSTSTAELRSETP
ncbi:MAG: efflux RND transporter periplasmic adaptor subunit [Alphaproteobacteria bacterium]|nr:efflux RND transporter periplasmic adaptor subunit [Alphaproteobacteria bacterium]